MSASGYVEIIVYYNQRRKAQNGGNFTPPSTLVTLIECQPQDAWSLGGNCTPPSTLVTLIECQPQDAWSLG